MTELEALKFAASVFYTFSDYAGEISTEAYAAIRAISPTIKEADPDWKIGYPSEEAWEKYMESYGEEEYE